MPSHRGYAGTVKRGQSITFRLPIQTRAGVVRDYTGATVQAWIRPVSSADTAVSVAAQLDTNPAAEPQVLVTLTDAQTSALTAPGQVNVDVTVTHSSGGIDKPTAYFDIVEADVHAS